jgi:hypothetical protein
MTLCTVYFKENKLKLIVKHYEIVKPLSSMKRANENFKLHSRKLVQKLKEPKQTQ